MNRDERIHLKQLGGFNDDAVDIFIKEHDWILYPESRITMGHITNWFDWVRLSPKPGRWRVLKRL